MMLNRRSSTSATAVARAFMAQIVTQNNALGHCCSYHLTPPFITFTAGLVWPQNPV